MPEERRERPAEPNLPSIEGDSFRLLVGFHNKTMNMLRQASLEDDKLNMVSERIASLLEDMTAEMERTKDFSILSGRLDTAEAEVRQLIDELSNPDHECSNDEQAPPLGD